eukprot:CAMPEP_0172491702 /NCGR_PEP_ID=MMETSP1066-20121228/22563_1 /TAXON_ID=671091 /ORGANISM="Coscinodiscus wailesii, Strain CCMP2513" /LENGTH=162 /DNA_ID=CAMNT_0013260871 /DNA_START=136 /DNA_END=624 /DNA_ORIENTATION=-
MTLCVILFLRSSTAFVPSSSAKFAPMKLNKFVTPPSITRTINKKDIPDILNTLNMAGDAEAEAQRLREQAQKLREEVASMSPPPVEEAKTEEVVVQTVQKSGDLYDDEVAEYKDPLSDTMRKRLMAEASTGLDSDKPQTNVILYISLGIIVLILLGGQGILY